MADKPTLTFAFMDPPFETGRTATFFRMLDICARRGYDIKVFAYEGAVALPFSLQKAHANSVLGRDAAEEHHPLPKDWVAALIKEAEKNGGSLSWVNCGLCVDERGVNAAIDGVSRGSPSDFWKLAEASDNSLVIPTR
jgi:tRNA 2-thiouridine synthesizing protein D